MFSLKYLIASSINSSPILFADKLDNQNESGRRSFLPNFQTLNCQFSVKTVQNCFVLEKTG
jgi:hypothetical protein